MTDLPSSGEPGVRPPTPGMLPRPAMWPQGAVETPFLGAEDDTSTPASPGRRRAAYLAVALMVVGVVAVGMSLVLTSWPLLLVGVVVGSVGAVLAWKARIMEDVSTSDSPHG